MARLHLACTLTHYRWDTNTHRLIAGLSWMNAEAWCNLDKLALLHTCTATLLGVCALVLAARGCEDAFVRRNQDMSLHWAETAPNCSKTEAPHDRQLSVHHAGGTSTKTYLKRSQNPTEQQRERGLRKCERNSPGDTWIIKGEEGGAWTPLQPIE